MTSGPRGASRAALFIAALLAIYVVAFLAQWYVPAVTDVSWLFVIGEKLFSGEHLYTDIMETNPPMSVLLYLPTLALAHWSRLSPEFLQILLTLLLVTLSVGWSSRILVRTGQIADLVRYRLLAAVMFAILPLGCYSEREHFALLLTLPALAIIAARIMGHAVPPGVAVLAGLGAGLSAAIKPQMAFPVLLAVAWGVWRMRSLRLAFQLEHWVAVAVVAVYAAMVVVWFPDYFTNMLPLLMDTYRPVRYAFTEMAFGDGAIGYYLIVAGIVLVAGRDVLQPRLMVPVLASVGYYASYLEQSKGWAYHLYPAIGLSALILFNEAITRAYAADVTHLRGRLRLTGQLGALVASLAGGWWLCDWLEGRQWDSLPLASQIRKLSDHPSISIISDDLGLTNPLIRMVDGKFVGTVASQWITNYARYRIAHGNLDAAGIDRMNAWIDYDRELLAKDIRRGRPEFIVVDRGGFDWLEWARQSPELAQLLNPYRQAGRANDIYLLARADIAPDQPHPATGRFWRLGGSDRWKGLDRDDLATRGIKSAAR